jgi:hypothetical protein
VALSEDEIRRIREAARKAAESAPPLTPEQVDKIVLLIGPELRKLRERRQS